MRISDWSSDVCSSDLFAAQVGHAGDGDRAAILVRIPGNAPHRGIAAIGRADDAHALRIGDALADRPAHAVADIVLHREAELSLSGAQEILAIAGRAAAIGLGPSITPPGQELCPIIIR